MSFRYGAIIEIAYGQDWEDARKVGPVTLQASPVQLSLRSRGVGATTVCFNVWEYNILDSGWVSLHRKQIDEDGLSQALIHYTRFYHCFAVHTFVDHT